MKQRKRPTPKPATSRTPFRLGQRSDRCGNGVLDVMKKTGRKHAKPPEVANPDEVKDMLRDIDIMRVVWSLDCGTKLTFQRGFGPDNERPQCFRIVEIELADGRKIGDSENATNS